MDTKRVQSIVEYWRKTADHDNKTMQVLFRSKRFSDSLFFGHILLEKILKAHVVLQTKKQAPYIHDLVRLAEMAQLNLSDEQLDILDTANEFNIRSRYPEYKLLFYKKCTKAYTSKHFHLITDLYKELCQRLKQKK